MAAHRYTPTTTRTVRRNEWRNRILAGAGLAGIVILATFGTGGDANGPIPTVIGGATVAHADEPVTVPDLTVEALPTDQAPVVIEAPTTEVPVIEVGDPAAIADSEIAEPASALVETTTEPVAETTWTDTDTTDGVPETGTVDNDVVTGIAARNGGYSAAYLYCTGYLSPVVIDELDYATVDLILTTREAQLAEWGNLGTNCEFYQDEPTAYSPSILTDHETEIAVLAAQLAATCDFTGDMADVLGAEDSEIVDTILTNSGC